MKLTIFNGSPRGSKSNSNAIIEWFKKGLPNDIYSGINHFFLRNDKKYPDMIKALKNSDIIFIVFPLYTDAMPAIVKKFIEYLGDNKSSVKGKRFIFVVHSGFPEATQSRGVERYLKRLTTRLQGEYLGTIVKGGSEGLRLMPPLMTKKTRNALLQIGKTLASDGILDENSVKILANPEHLSTFRLLFYRIMGFLGLSNMYWNGMLKQNKAYKLRNDAPYSKF